MPQLLITIHDVAPPLMPRVARLWDLCATRKVKPGLLVVPDWHGSSPIENDANCVSWIRARADEGAEVFLHGERHDEVGSPRAWRDSLRALGRTNREGEFLTLAYDSARSRIDRGLVVGPTTQELAEIKALRKEVADQQRTIEILKAATTFFARENDPSQR